MGAPIEILHVEADPEIRTIVDISLRLDPSFSVIGVASGADALSVLKRGNFSPTAILLDYYVDGMTGVDLLHQLRETPSWADMPAAFLTARIQAHAIERMMSAGAVGVLTKPFNPVTLARDLRTLLRC